MNDGCWEFNQKELLERPVQISQAETPTSLPFRGRVGQPELDRLLARVHHLHPIARVAIEKNGTRFVFARPVPWPLFVRLDVAAALTPNAAALSARLGRLSVLSFTFGDGMFWARIGAV